MSGRFKTLSRKDPEFSSYLDGSFSDQYWALPIRSLNVGTLGEEVTFEVIPRSDQSRPGPVVIARHLIRPRSLVFSVGPMVTVLFFCLAHGVSVHRLSGVTAFLGVVLFHVTVNLFNDYGDHMSGQDRLRPQGGSRAIQKGWITARAVKRAALLCLMGSALLGLPTILYSSNRLLLVAALAALIALEFAFQSLRLKERGWAEILAFFLLGPLLVLGYFGSVAEDLGGPIFWPQVLLGCIFGSIALLYYHAANFETLMLDEQAGARTWATRAGFDASKLFFYFTALLVVLTTAAYVVLAERGTFFISVMVAQIFFLFPVSLRVKSLASPLSSGLTGLRHEAVKLCALTVTALVGVYLFAWTSAK